jgi:hypothetical protein
MPSHKLSYFTASQFDGIRYVWVGTYDIFPEGRSAIDSDTAQHPKPFYSTFPPVLFPIIAMPTEYPSLHSSPTLLSIPVGILPPLPKIRSEQIRKRIFTHSSLAGENRYGFQAPESDPSTDNEE